MKNRERLLQILNFNKPDDRLPVIEWANYWDKTLERWENESLPKGLANSQVETFFGLDQFILIRGNPRLPDEYKLEWLNHPLIYDKRSYSKIKDSLFSVDNIEGIKQTARTLCKRHRKGEITIRLWLDGYFWLPRKLMGIEEHLYALYDKPSLIHRINKDLTEFNIRLINEILKITKPDLISIAEDMSYNHGPMLSEELYDEFICTYYRQIIPTLKEKNLKVFVDSDGDITSMIPWLKKAGIDGVLPLEKQAGVDIVHIREAYPDFLLMGGYNKLVMDKGEDLIIKEFERIFPVMCTGGFLPSVDHQTPPEVSIENYREYIKQFKHYAKKAVECWKGN